MNSSSICISLLFSSYSYDNAHKFHMFTSLMYKPSHRNGKLLKIITKVSGSIRSFRNPSEHIWAEFCAAWWDSLCKAGTFQQINPNELELFQFTQADKLLWHFVALKNLFHFECVWGCGNYFSPEMPGLFVKALLMTEKSQGIPVTCPMWCLSLTRSVLLSSEELERGINLYHVECTCTLRSLVSLAEGHVSLHV